MPNSSSYLPVEYHMPDFHEQYGVFMNTLPNYLFVDFESAPDQYTALKEVGNRVTSLSIAAFAEWDLGQRSGAAIACHLFSDYSAEICFILANGREEVSENALDYLYPTRMKYNYGINTLTAPLDTKDGILYAVTKFVVAAIDRAFIDRLGLQESLNSYVDTILRIQFLFAYLIADSNFRSKFVGEMKVGSDSVSNVNEVK